jgi:group I intron endonuclease
MSICSIYKIINEANGKVYIGQTWSPVLERFRKHGYASSNCVKIRNAINKYGSDNFKIELITVCSTQEVADHLEMYFIKQYNSIENGYNVLMGGKTGSRKGLRHSEETKIKLSLKARDRRHSEETKNKLSELKKGKTLSKEHREKLSLSKRGKVFSVEHKANLLGNHKGMTWKLVDGKRVWSDK